MTARPGLQWSPGAAGPVVKAGSEDQARLPCASGDPELFFTAAGESAAKALCRGCPARGRCLNLAITSDLRDGVWGGLSESERLPLHQAHTGRLLKAGRKRCGGCGDVKPVTEFKRFPRTADGYQGVCKPCRTTPAACTNGHLRTAGNTRTDSAGHIYCTECRERRQLAGEEAA
jgi:transcription factor WhiB